MSDTYNQLLAKSGAADVAVSAHEREHGCRQSDAYDALLLASADAKAALRVHMAKRTGVWAWSLFSKQPTD
jgi:hypothetical protein